MCVCVEGGGLDCLSLEAVFEELFVMQSNKVAQETGSERGGAWGGSSGAGESRVPRSQEPPASAETPPEAAREMASSGRVTPQNCFEQKMGAYNAVYSTTSY